MKLEEVKQYEIFSDRVISIFEQYKNKIVPNDPNYCRTLFVSSCYGLLLFPPIEAYNKLPTTSIKGIDVSSNLNSCRSLALFLRNVLVSGTLILNNEKMGLSEKLTTIIFESKDGVKLELEYNELYDIIMHICSLLKN